MLYGDWLLERVLEFAKILVIASEQSRGSNLGILEFPSLLTAALQKLLRRFSAACALKIQRKIFAAAAADAPPRLAQRL